MNYFYPPPPQIPPYRTYATTIDFRNPSAANIQQVLKENWTTFAIVGAVGIFLGITKLIPWANPTLHYITGGLGLAAAGYGYMLSKGNTA